MILYDDLTALSIENPLKASDFKGFFFGRSKLAIKNGNQRFLPSHSFRPIPRATNTTAPPIAA
jgi:hypothetical protein